MCPNGSLSDLNVRSDPVGPVPQRPECAHDLMCPSGSPSDLSVPSDLIVPPWVLQRPECAQLMERARRLRSLLLRRSHSNYIYYNSTRISHDYQIFVISCVSDMEWKKMNEVYHNERLANAPPRRPQQPPNALGRTEGGSVWRVNGRGSRGGSLRPPAQAGRY